MFGPDWLANLFLGVFLFGLIFTIASLVLGFVGGGAAGPDGGADIHVDVGGHDVQIDGGGHNGHAGADATSHGPGILNMPTIMATITWFGGIGYILRQSLGMNGYIAAFLAVLSGLVGGTIMFTLLARVLWPMMTKPLDKADFRLPGTAARVVSSIRAGGVGEIVYSKQGTRFTAGAKSIDDGPVAKGAEVVIIRYERGIAYVQDVAALLPDREEVRDDREASVG